MKKIIILSLAFILAITPLISETKGAEIYGCFCCNSILSGTKCNQEEVSDGAGDKACGLVWPIPDIDNLDRLDYCEIVHKKGQTETADSSVAWTIEQRKDLCSDTSTGTCIPSGGVCANNICGLLPFDTGSQTCDGTCDNNACNNNYQIMGKLDRCPTTTEYKNTFNTDPNGFSCRIVVDERDLIGGGDYVYSPWGHWDASEGKCITCAYAIIDTIIVEDVAEEEGLDTKNGQIDWGGYSDFYMDDVLEGLDNTEDVLSDHPILEVQTIADPDDPLDTYITENRQAFYMFTGNNKCESACAGLGDKFVVDSACDEVTIGTPCKIGELCESLTTPGNPVICNGEFTCDSCVCNAPLNTCGDGEITEEEECDGGENILTDTWDTDAADQTCNDLTGEINAVCIKPDTFGTNEDRCTCAVCGDGEVEGNEQCEYDWDCPSGATCDSTCNCEGVPPTPPPPPPEKVCGDPQCPIGNPQDEQIRLDKDEDIACGNIEYNDYGSGKVELTITTPWNAKETEILQAGQSETYESGTQTWKVGVDSIWDSGNMVYVTAECLSAGGPAGCTNTVTCNPCETISCPAGTNICVESSAAPNHCHTNSECQAIYDANWGCDIYNERGHECECIKMVETICNEGIDDDEDGCTDDKPPGWGGTNTGPDSDCGGKETDYGGDANCEDGTDNDCDGKTDCLDVDCKDTAPSNNRCQVINCVEDASGNGVWSKVTKPNEECSTNLECISTTGYCNIETCACEEPEPFEDVETKTQDSACRLMKALQGIAAVLAAILIILAGIKWLTSEDKPEARQGAKEMIKRTLIGLTIIIVALQLINYAFGNELGAITCEYETTSGVQICGNVYICGQADGIDPSDFGVICEVPDPDA